MAAKTRYRKPQKKQGEFSINTMIGVDTFVRGDVEASGFTRVDGNMKGNLHVNGRVVVGESARMRSSISGTRVIVGGVVDGNILASEQLIVLSSALIIGDIVTRRIEADEGCLIHGKVRVCPNEESWQRAKSEFKDKKASLSGAAPHYGSRT